MKIADYHIHNVLKDFSQQLRRRLAPGAAGLLPAPAAGRRPSGQAAVIRQVLTTIVDRVGRLDAAPPQVAPGGGNSHLRGEFIYQVQPPSGDRLTLHLEIEDPRHLVRRFHDLATEEDLDPQAP